MLMAALYTLKSFSLPLKGRFLLMYLHLGQDTIVMTDRILGVFDLDNTTVSKHTRDYLGRAQREGRVIDVTYELPKSFIVCENDGIEKIYLSQMSPATLLRRVREDNVG
jgi:regulator of extracellular matrix RemA (YlzA/DUF370 family)